MVPEPDFVESLGTLVLAHRLKRTMLRLMEESAETHRRLDLPVKPRWISTLLLLEAEGPLTVTEVADRLRLSHPAVVQILDDIAGEGLVRRARDPKDGRRSVLSLSRKGTRLMPELHRAWKVLADAQDRLLKEAGGDVLGALERMNAALDRRSLVERVVDRVEKTPRRN